MPSPTVNQSRTLTTTNIDNQPHMVLNNHNLLHVKFHVNKFQDNLLSKRLQQLNVEEMKVRLKHQRTSNELVLFLRECQQSTGYLSKMKQIDNSNFSHLDSNLLRQTSNTNETNSHLSNAVKNMINASILVVDTNNNNPRFESKSCHDYSTLKNKNRSDDKKLKTSPKCPQNVLKRVRSQSLYACPISEVTDVKKSHFLSSSPVEDLECEISDEIEIEKLDLMKSRRLNSKSAGCFQGGGGGDNRSNVKIPLFEHILLNSNSSPINSRSNLLSKVCSSSSRSDSSTFSNSSESLNDLVPSSQPSQQPQSQLQKIRPITCNIMRSKRTPLSSLNNKHPIQNQSKITIPPLLQQQQQSSSANFANTATYSNLDWFTNNALNNLSNDKPPNNKTETTVVVIQNSPANLFTKNPNINNKTKKILIKKSPKKNPQILQPSLTESPIKQPDQQDFKSKSLNFLLNSNQISTFNGGKYTTSSSSSSTGSSSSYYTSSSLMTTKISDNNINKSVNGPKKSLQLLQRGKKSSICSLSSSSTSTGTTSGALSNYLAAQQNSLQQLPMKQQQRFPIQVNMSRGSMKKKQMEIINEYNRYNTLELLNNLRKIQHNLDARVKQFTTKTMKESLD